jgi:ABC-type Zn uptake system ZnuABC Zn-binding protein ZnuA
MTTTKTRAPLTFDHLKSLKKPRRKTIEVIGSDEALELVRELQEALEDEEDPATKTRLEAELKAAQDALEAATIRITFESVGRKRYEDLIAAHPATEAQNKESQKEAGQDAPYNVDTFPAALISASAISPTMTLDQAQELWDDWNSGELTEIFFSALEVNTARRTGLGKEFGGVKG